MVEEEQHNFETAFAELEQIVRELESGEITLEESLGKFERGVELYQYCQAELSKVEEKVRILADKLSVPETEPVEEFLDRE